MLQRKIFERLRAEAAAGRGRLRVPRRPPRPGSTGRQPAAADRPPDSLEVVAAEVAGCRRCALGETRSCAVPGEGSRTAALMFVGEAPGEEEDRQGRPFVGPAGQLLTRMIAAMGLAREQVFIANVVKCRPPGNREPLPEEVAACKDYLRRQIALLRPKVIITLGAHAARWFLGGGISVSRVRGNVSDQGEFKVVPTYHPSYLLRNPGEKRKAWEDLKVAMGLLGLSR